MKRARRVPLFAAAALAVAAAALAQPGPGAKAVVNKPGALAQIKDLFGFEPEGLPNVSVKSVTVENLSQAPRFRVELSNAGPGWARQYRIGVRSPIDAWTRAEGTQDLLRGGQTATLILVADRTLAPGRYAYEVGALMDIDNPFDLLNRGTFDVPVPGVDTVQAPTFGDSQDSTPAFDARVEIAGVRENPDGKLRVEVRLSNPGPDEAPAGVLRLRVAGAPATGAPSPAIPAGGSRLVVLVTANPPGPGQHQVQARIFPGAAAGGGRDTDPSNDQASRDVVIQGPSPPPNPGPSPWWLVPVCAALAARLIPPIWRPLRPALRLPPDVRVIAASGGSGAVVREVAPSAGWEIEVLAIRDRGRAVVVDVREEEST